MVDFKVGHYYKRIYDDGEVTMFKVTGFSEVANSISVRTLYNNRHPQRGYRYMNRVLYFFSYDTIDIEIDESEIIAKVL